MTAQIVHARIDYRLIHGQVITKWLKQCGADRIIIIDDNLSKDKFMGQIYKMAAPTGIQVDIVSVAQAKNLWLPNKTVKGRIFLLFKSIEMAIAAIGDGLRLNSLQLGGYEQKDDRKNVHYGIYMSTSDGEKLKGIAETGVRIYFQTIPGEEIEELDKILKKLN
ncbi:PTS system mannose/fructose/N-acetylgalactosamine-transporter subunit IIB [[Clostridium] innocuum]|uniref:PTS system mannose/fructose/N-acetylgalactosamine-transporter subunit IIB n=1 Tax=Clostridium TaxID=1485 RepID=UPI00356A27B0